MKLADLPVRVIERGWSSKPRKPGPDPLPEAERQARKLARQKRWRKRNPGR